MVNWNEKVKNSLSGLDDQKPSDAFDLSGTYIFFSFDLVNSTFYKNKFVGRWAKTYSEFFGFCKQKIGYNYLSKARLWKMVGDEILFFMPISHVDELIAAPNEIFNFLSSAIHLIHKADEEARAILSVKATMWGALIHDIDTNKETNYGNVLIKEPFADDNNVIYDFLGPDIDIGFRIAKHSLRGKLVIDAKLACLISRIESASDNVVASGNMRIVSYERLKGVWDDRPYPIVWYYDKWEEEGDMFVYDERFNSPIIEKILRDGCSGLSKVKNLNKIFSDLNKDKEIDDIRAGIKNNPKGFVLRRIPSDRISELHLVAICINEKNQLLVSKRTQKDEFPEKWEFGCSQLQSNQSFADAMINGYKNDFGLQLSFFETAPMPISQYQLVKKKEGNRIIPGLIFVARVNSEKYSADSFNKDKHSEVLWLSQNEALQLNEADCVPDFHDSVNKAFRYIESK